jgi:hypothetical protein
MAHRSSRTVSRARESGTRSVPGLALSSGWGVASGFGLSRSGHAGRDAGHDARIRAGAEEAKLLSNWESRCARTLPARSGRLADEPARILGPAGRGRSD